MRLAHVFAASLFLASPLFAASEHSINCPLGPDRKPTVTGCFQVDSSIPLSVLARVYDPIRVKLANPNVDFAGGIVPANVWIHSGKGLNLEEEAEKIIITEDGWVVADAVCRDPNSAGATCQYVLEGTDITDVNLFRGITVEGLLLAKPELSDFIEGGVVTRNLAFDTNLVAE